MGIVVHLMACTNRIFTADDYGRMIIYGNEEFSLGRLLLSSFQIISTTKYNINAVSGVVSILFLSATVELILAIFEVKKKISQVLIAAIIITSPCAFSTMVFPCASSAYFIAFFLAFLALFLLTKVETDKGVGCIILAMILIVISMMIYQIYATIIVVAFLTKLLVDYLCEDKSVINKVNLRNLCTIIVGFVFYIFLYKLFFVILKIEPADYQGFNKSGPRMNLKSLLTAMERTFSDFYRFWTGQRICFYAIVNCLFWISVIIAVVVYILEASDKIRKSVGVIALLFGMLEASFMLHYTSSGVYYHNIMTWGCCFFYVFLIVLMERRTVSVLNYACTIIISIICIYNYQNGNVGYMQLDISRTKTDYMVQKIMSDIDEISDGSEKIVIVGDMTIHDSGTNMITIPEIEVANETVGVVTPLHLERYLDSYYGKRYDFADENEQEMVLKTVLSDEGDHTAVYPYGGYCFKSGDYIILNFEN